MPNAQVCVTEDVITGVATSAALGVMVAVVVLVVDNASMVVMLPVVTIFVLVVV